MVNMSLKHSNDEVSIPDTQDAPSTTEQNSRWKDIGHISLLFIAVRVIQYILVLLTPLSSFDNSTGLLLDTYASKEEQNMFINKYIVNKLLPWDSVFFIKGIMSPESLPAYEHEFAFSITWTNLLKCIYKMVYHNTELSFYRIVTMSIILNNILHYLSIVTLYHLTFIVFSPKMSTTYNRYATRMAKKASVLHVFSSAGGFLLGVYSEPLSCLLSFVGMLAREYCTKDISYKQSFKNPIRSFILYTVISTFCFSVATWNRSNCLLLGIFYLYDLFQLVKIKSYQRAIQFPLLSGIPMAVSIIVQQYYIPYNHFCPERGEWCDTSLFNNSTVSFITKESLYSYIQNHYWNVGLMSYWTPNNIPNFLFGLPNLIILAYSSFYYSWIYPKNSLQPLIIISMLFWFLMLFIANTQIINRVITFIPLHLWYMSDRLIKNSNDDNKKDIKVKNDDILVKYYIYWVIVWIAVQTILFASFLPPA